MDMSRLTTKSQEAIQAAQTKATRYGHLEVDGEHLLLALLEQAERPGAQGASELENLRRGYEGADEEEWRKHGSAVRESSPERFTSVGFPETARKQDRLKTEVGIYRWTQPVALFDEGG